MGIDGTNFMSRGVDAIFTRPIFLPYQG